MGFIVERSLNTSGAYTSEYATLLAFGQQSGSLLTNTPQSTLVIGGSVFNVVGSLPVVIADISTSCAANGNIALSPVFPSYGQFGNPMTQAGSGRAADLTDGTIYTVTLYGTTMHFIASKSALSTQFFGPNNASCLLMRYD